MDPSQFQKQYEAIISIIEGNVDGNDDEEAYFASAYFRYQFQMIARLLDTASLRLDSIESSEKCPEFTILTQAGYQERLRSPFRSPLPVILFGSNDPTYCPLIGLALWLEYTFSEGRELVFETSNTSTGTAEAKVRNIKNLAHRILSDVKRSTEFINTLEDLGLDLDRNRTCLRILAAKAAVGMGLCPRDLDYRTERNLLRKRSYDDYSEDEDCFSFSNINVGCALCKGGPVGYKVKPDSKISDSWILQNVVPNISSKLNRAEQRNAVLVLGKALLWKVFEDSSNYVPAEISQRIRRAYNQVLHAGDEELHAGDDPTEAGDNPIKKVPLVLRHRKSDYTVVIEEEQSTNRFSLYI